MESKKAELVETGSRLVVTRARGGGGSWGDVVKGYELATRRLVSSGDLIHSTVITVNNTVLCTSKLLRD